MKKVQFNVRIDKDILEWMRDNHWPIGTVINGMLRARVEDHKRKQMNLFK
ncbi:MAG: hypothetical protein IJH65_11125 [Methanobrevibacter sp.]|nr:hypothetical protein [Methanobrevibacter sp.]